MAKKKNTLLVCQFRPAGLKFVKKYKSLAVEGGRDDYIVWMTAQNTFFFQLPGSCAPGDKKVQNGSSVGLHAVSPFMQQQLQNVRKKKQNKKGVPVTEILNTCSR